MPGATTSAGVIAMGSAMVLQQTGVLVSSVKCEKYYAWAIACSAVSFLLSTVVCQGLAFGVEAVASHLGGISLFLLVWWTVGVGAMTFKAPYSVEEAHVLGAHASIGNGYFGAWAALGAAWMLAAQSWPQLKAPFEELSRDAGSVVGLLLCSSGAVMVQAGVDCNDAGVCEKEPAYILAAGTIGFVALLAIVAMSIKGVGCVKSNWRGITAFFLVWWVAATFVATEVTNSPFEIIGNGYFGCWGSVVASAMLASEAWRKKGAAGAPPEPGNAREVLMLVFFSAVVLVRAIRDCSGTRGLSCDHWFGWAIACSAVSMVVGCVLLRLAQHGNTGAAQTWASFFLLVWWAAGWYCMTMEAPYVIPGNGFFGTWGAFICSVKMVAASPPPFLAGAAGAGKEARGNDLMMMTIAGGVVLAESAMRCSDAGVECTEYLAYGVAVGAVGVVLGAALMSPVGARVPAKPAALFACAWWACGAGVLTFDRPYQTAQNAYFGAWAGAITATLLALQQWGVDVSVRQITLGMDSAKEGSVSQEGQNDSFSGGNYNKFEENPGEVQTVHAVQVADDDGPAPSAE